MPRLFYCLTPDILTPAVCPRYVYHLAQKGNRPRTVRAHFDAIRFFCRFLMTMKLLSEIRLSLFSEEAFAGCRSVCPENEEFLQQRDWDRNNSFLRRRASCRAGRSKQRPYALNPKLRAIRFQMARPQDVCFPAGYVSVPEEQTLMQEVFLCSVRFFTLTLSSKMMFDTMRFVCYTPNERLLWEEKYQEVIP